nr:immunoglobulin heavy chain junction region [Macaca mulatta]MPN69495.1 immunoglobulin heavy chain junction region [Macaca mulatta]MPN69555.1 immunoglobulin heavy chain junction region [Macaca mulatta]MPN69647.1 immunoglobulin heavy chain junction region [Macaca mulatta]MPN69790.1 immunoglobulin heavy chain junction region [Macaca mulatta]
CAREVSDTGTVIDNWFDDW